MAKLTHPDNRGESRQIPRDLLAFAPAEPSFDCRYDVEATGTFGCYISLVGKPFDLYFAWEILNQRGWLVRSFAPDV